MGAPDRVLARTIPKSELGETATWELQPLGDARQGGRPASLSARMAGAPDRERAAYERGRAQGHADAMRVAQQARATDLERLDRLLAQMHAQFDELHGQAADIVLDLALDIARQIVRRELADRPDATIGIVREAIALVADHQGHPRIHLAPQDFELVRGALENDGIYHGCRFVADPGIEPGGCRVETQQGEVDATLTTRWRRLVAVLGSTWPSPADDDAAPPGASAASADGRP